VYGGGSSLLLDIAGQPTPEALSPDIGLLNNQMPYFDLPNLAGDHVRSSDFIDTPLVIMFWSTWNTQAADEMHILDQYLADSFAQNHLVKVVAINSQEERSTVSSFMNRGGYQVQTLLDIQGLTSEKYNIKSIPTFYFVNRAGVIQEIYSGALSERSLMNKIEKILQ
jgi:peroxiredoxin